MFLRNNFMPGFSIDTAKKVYNFGRGKEHGFRGEIFVWSGWKDEQTIWSGKRILCGVFDTDERSVNKGGYCGSGDSGQSESEVVAGCFCAGARVCVFVQYSSGCDIGGLGMISPIKAISSEEGPSAELVCVRIA